MDYFDTNSTDIEEGNTRKPILQLDNIHKTYLLGVEGVAALRGVSLDIYEGEWVSIFGPSGSGKTSMLNIIGTIDKPTKGSISICGTRITPKTTDETLAKLRREKLGFVFQTFNLLSTMHAIENVELPMILQGSLAHDARASRAHDLLGRVGLGHRKEHLPTMLSGGEQQRVTIARAISNQPVLLLLDEPTGDLDSANTNLVIQMLKELNEIEHLTLVMVTHDVGLKDFADRVVWMRDGKIQRIETISPSMKKERAEQLATDLEAAGIVRAPITQNDDEEVEEPTEFPSTNVRAPNSYEPFRYAVKQGTGSAGLFKYLERATSGRVPERWIKASADTEAQDAEESDMRQVSFTSMQSMVEVLPDDGSENTVASPISGRMRLSASNYQQDLIDGDHF